MSGKKNSIEGLSYHLDSQFQVQTLMDDSSQSSSKKDCEHEDRIYQDVSDEQRQAKSIKSEDSIDQTQMTTEFPKINYNQNLSNDLEKDEDINESSFQTYTPQKKAKKAQNNFSLSPTDQQQQKYEEALQKKRKKRKLIFNSIKLRSNQKSKFGSGIKNIPKQDTEAIQISKQQTTFSRASFEKKRQNHALLKSWNYRRLQAIQLHKKISQNLIKMIDKTSKNSLQNFEIFRTFFTQKCRQQQMKINLKLPIKQQIQSNSHATDIYIASSSFFCSMIKRQKQQKQIIAKFINFVQTKIIKDIFDDYLNSTYKKMVALRSKINIMKQTLDKLDEVGCKKLIQLQTSFTKCCQNVLQDQPNDFYRTEISFLIKCQSQISLHNKYGQLIIEYYKQAIEDQHKRKMCIQKSLNLFLIQNQKYEQRLTFSKAKQSSHKILIDGQSRDSIQTELSSNNGSNQIQELYKIHNMLQQPIIEQIKRKRKKRQLLSEKQLEGNEREGQNRGQIDQGQITDWLTKLQIEQFDCYHLIIKKFKIQILKQEKWIPGEIVITVDKFVHIFVYAIRNTGVLIFGSQNFYQPQFTMKAYFVKITLPPDSSNAQMGSEDELEVLLGTNKQQSGLQKFAAFLKNSKKTEETVRFSTQNNLLEFQDYLIQLST